MEGARYHPELFAELYDVQPQAITWMRPVWDADEKNITDFEYVYSNQEGLKYLNLTPEAFAGLRLSNSPTLDDPLRKSVLEEMTRVYHTGRESKTDIYNPALNKYARVLRTRLRDGVLTVIQDRSDENHMIRQLEARTREAEEQKNMLDNILKNSSNGISVSRVFRDSTGKVVDAQTILANDAAVQFIGFPREVYLNKRATEIEPAVMDSPYYRSCIQTLETGKPFLMQYQMQSTGKWLELTVSRMDNDHLIQVFTDVTAVRTVQTELEQAAATLQLVFHAAQAAMFTLAPIFDEQDQLVDFRFEMVNAALADYAGQQPETLRDTPAAQWFPGYRKNGMFDSFRSVLETGEPVRAETHYPVKGEDHYLDLQAVKIGDRLFVTLTDHTSLRKSQIQLEQTIKALERSNTHLADFAHAASHDLKEPLRKIRTFTERLKSGMAGRMDEKESGYFDRIESAAERMQLLVDDLLEFSHVSTESEQLESVDLSEKLQRVLADLELQIEEKSARIDAGPLPMIKGHRRQLQQLFQNLISNALKYSKPGIRPEIIIRSEEVRGADTPFDLPAELQEQMFYCITVQDNGIGFEPQYGEQIFEMFKRLHGRMEYAGTGVGLSIARKVAENHKGYIRADSSPGNGATFTILFPKA